MLKRGIVTSNEGSSLGDIFRDTARTLARDRVSASVITALRSAGVGAILLKGPSFAQWLYDDGTPRPYRDTDILLRDTHMPVAGGVLTNLGFERQPFTDLRQDKPWHAEDWLRTSDGARIDLHRTLIGVAAPPPVAWSVLATRTERARIGGATVDVLAVDARALHVALHAAQNGRRGTQAMTDLSRALDRLPLETWRAAAALAGELGAESAMAVGLRLDPQGAKVADRLGLTVSSSVQLRLQSSGAPGEALGVAWFMQLPTRRAQAVWLLGKVLPPVAFMRVWEPGPERTPLEARATHQLPMAYAFRLLWLCARGPAAVRAWRRAQRWPA